MFIDLRPCVYHPAHNRGPAQGEKSSYTCRLRRKWILMTQWNWRSAPIEGTFCHFLRDREGEKRMREGVSERYRKRETEGHWKRLRDTCFKDRKRKRREGRREGESEHHRGIRERHRLKDGERDPEKLILLLTCFKISLPCRVFKVAL